MHRIISWIAAGSVLIVASAPARAVAADTFPDWLRMPTAEETQNAWPSQDSRNALGGKAEIGCTLTAQGDLRNCRVIFETPANAGFGAAALSLIPKFHLRPATHDGRPVDAGVVIPVAFDMPAWPDRAPPMPDILAAWPHDAFRHGVGGVVQLHCLTTAQGGVDHCGVISETPAGQGFGAAALSLAPKIGVTPAGHLGQATDGVVDVPVVFANPDWIGGATSLPWKLAGAPATPLDWFIRIAAPLALLGGLAQLVNGRPFKRETRPILHWGWAVFLSVWFSVFTVTDAFAAWRVIGRLLAGPMG